MPDILILDIIMPHLDGLGVLERLREMDINPQPKIIMLTAFGQENITQKSGAIRRFLLYTEAFRYGSAYEPDPAACAEGYLVYNFFNAFGFQSECGAYDQG